MIRLGVISDTHGLIRPQALDALRGCQALLHAGDIGSREVLDALQALAPVTCVRGNNDLDDWASRIPESITIEIESVRIHLLHDLKELVLDPAAQRLGVIVAGHSHRPAMQTRGGVLYFNPGSAGPRRFKLPVAVGVLEVGNGAVQGRIVELNIAEKH